METPLAGTTLYEKYLIGEPVRKHFQRKNLSIFQAYEKEDEAVYHIRHGLVAVARIEDVIVPCYAKELHVQVLDGYSNVYRFLYTAIGVEFDISQLDAQIWSVIPPDALLNLIKADLDKLS